MPSPRKFNGPCPDHSAKKAGCRHCNAYYMQRRYYRSDVPPPEKNYETSFERRHYVTVYRGLHWPAPIPTEST